MKSQRPITLAGIDTEVYRIKRRANLLLIVIDIKLGRKIGRSKRDYLVSLSSILTEMHAIPYLLNEKEYPRSHYQISNRQTRYPEIVKLYKEIIGINRELLAKIVAMEMLYVKTTLEIKRLEPIELWDDWVERVIRKTDDLLKDIG